GLHARALVVDNRRVRPGNGGLRTARLESTATRRLERGGSMRFADGLSVEVDTYIEASPEQVWAVAVDLTRMGEWSSENKGGEWMDGEPSLGVHFRGVN